jgi:hypothetical protein
MKKILLGFSCLLSISLFAQNFQPVWQLKKGEKFLVTSNIKNSSNQMMMESMSNIATDIEAEVTTVDSFSTINCFNKALLINSNLMNQKLNYDSKNTNDTSKAGMILKDWMGKKSTVKFDSKGNATSSLGQSQAEPAFDMDIQKMIANQMLSQINQSNNVETVFTKFFGKHLQKGESFKDTSNSTDGLTTNTTYTLTAIENGQAIFTVNGKQEITGTREMMGQPMETKGTSSTTGEILVEAKTGILIKQKLLVDTKLNITANGMNIPMDSKTEFEIVVMRM